jgi:hypothetical protein
MTGELEMKKDIGQPLLEGGEGGFPVTPKEMASVCHTDATHTDVDDKEAPERLVSSKLILQDFGGYEGIATRLKTNL